MQHDDASLQVRDEREIDLSLPDGSQLRKWELKCQICEVKVTARGLRKHMTQKHGELWQAVRPQVDKLCSAWSMGIQENICQFCNSSYGTRNVHALSCHAITQTALARVKTLFESNASVNHGPVGGTGGSADAGSVRSSQHGREAHADTAAGGGRRQEAAQAKRQRGTGQGMDGQKQKVPSQPRDIRAILRDGGGRLGGHDEAAMQGIAVRQEDMLNILKQSTSWVIFAKTESPSIIPGLVAASQKWKEEITKPEQFVGQCQPQDDTLLVPPKPTHGDLQELDSGPATEGQGCRVEHGSGPMGVSEMVAGPIRPSNRTRPELHYRPPS